MSDSEFSFNRSRCREIIDAVIARKENSTESTYLPLEARIVLLLTIRAETAFSINPLLTEREKLEILKSQFRMLYLLIPELLTPEGKKTYKAISAAFTRDMLDLRSNQND